MRWNLNARQVGTAVGLALALALTPGCGGEGADNALGYDSEITVRLSATTNAALDDLELVIAPESGDVDDEDVCTLADANFCNSVRKDTSDRMYEFAFTTNADADEKPYYVYVRNKSTGTGRSFQIEVFVDGAEELDFEASISKESETKVAEIARNHATKSD